MGFIIVAFINGSQSNMDMGGTINYSLETSTKNPTADSTACQIYKYKAGRGCLILFSAFTVITQLASSIDIPANPAALPWVSPASPPP